MEKRLLLLAFLRDGPLTGYEVMRLVSAHGDLYSQLKKGNVYYLLDRLAGEGLVSMKSESGARGPRGERLVYSLTAAGRRELKNLLRVAIEDYQPPHGGVEVAAVLMSELPGSEARSLLRRRLEKAKESRNRLGHAMGAEGQAPGSAGDHMLLLADAEIRWIERAIDRLETRPGTAGRSRQDGRRTSAKSTTAPGTKIQAWRKP